jgi:cell division septum initiation protein DivIVA
MVEAKDPVNEIEKLLDELESFAEKSPWYLMNKIAIKDEDFFRITQRIRELLPTELAEAKAMLEKRDLILKNAQEEHRRILEAAEKRLEDLTSEDQVVIAARQHAGRIVERAQVEAESVKRDALLYTAELLTDMERQFQQSLQTIQNGRKFLEGEVTKQVSENLAAVDSAGVAPPPAGSAAGAV